jgi:putative peptide zinc metalloprotease protein
MSEAKHAARLPRLRADLQVIEPQSGASCTVFDPFRNKFFRLDAIAAQMLHVWPKCAYAEDLRRACDADFGTIVTVQGIESFSRWLKASELTDPVDEQDWRQRAAAVDAQRHGWVMWAVHNYLFVKLPLFSPQQALVALLPWLAVFFTRSFCVFVVMCGCLGLYLAGREWERLVAALPELFSLQASVLFVIAIAIVKSLHELGHAMTAVRFGCRVPSMGICFMVMVPMLYTDVSDAWKLPSRRQRVLIDAAGMIVELCVACLALLAWALLPEGPPKALAAMLATTSLLLSLGLNLNPFMRFDGYYILSDLIGVENLQTRSFALGRWKLREWLFGLCQPPPERFSPRMMANLIAYAWGVWLYRLIVFTGIAVLVYHMAFKLLGIVLFLIEIVYFIALPVWREAREWWTMRSAIANTKRSLITLAAAGCGIALVLLPWSTRIEIPAIIEDAEQAQLYSKRAAFVAETGVARGDLVKPGALIVALVAPDLDQEIVLTRLKLNQTQRRLERRSADMEERAQTHVLEQIAAGLESRVAGLEAEQRELRIVAPIAGVIAELDPHLEPGRWLQRTDLVALVRGTQRRVVRGYVSEADVARLDLDASATFVPEPLDQPRRHVVLTHVAPVGAGALDIVELASHYGGGVLTKLQQHPGERRQLTSVTGQFVVTATVPDESGPETHRTVRGLLHAQGRPESIVARTWRHVLKVLVRESGL